MIRPQDLLLALGTVSGGAGIGQEATPTDATLVTLLAFSCVAMPDDLIAATVSAANG